MKRTLLILLVLLSGCVADNRPQETTTDSFDWTHRDYVEFVDGNDQLSNINSKPHSIPVVYQHENDTSTIHVHVFEKAVTTAAEHEPAAAYEILIDRQNRTVIDVTQTG